MENVKKQLIVLGILSFMAACAPSPNVKSTCIPPLTDFAYFTGQGTPYPDEPVAPSDPWVLEMTVDLKNPVFLGIRVLPNKDKEFWFWDMGIWLADQSSLQQQLFILRTDGTGLKPVLLDDAAYEYSNPITHFFVAPDNSVWIIRQLSTGSQIHILEKYDETLGKMIPIVNLGEITPPYPNFSHQSPILMDEKTGVFWFLVPNGYIYSYDPASDSLIPHISITDMYPTGAVMTSDGTIYMYLFRHGLPIDGEHDALFLYSPQTESIEHVGIGLEVDVFRKNLFIDHTGRLWAGSFGWREPDGKWYQVIRPPEFVKAVVDGGGDRLYHWLPPDIRFETLNDVYWFTGEGGTYSLDFKTGEWCWVSTSPNLEKDTDGNLWMLVDNDLYRLSESP
ncbi:MAG: hypothetical protein HYZ25_19490 [Chloroflexi bacterium]|nr:hypothetical protein [Chloroflexota bacterium]